jgi:hypothetical protein
MQRLLEILSRTEQSTEGVHGCLPVECGLTQAEPILIGHNGSLTRTWYAIEEWKLTITSIYVLAEPA